MPLELIISKIRLPQTGPTPVTGPTLSHRTTNRSTSSDTDQIFAVNAETETETEETALTEATATIVEMAITAMDQMEDTEETRQEVKTHQEDNNAEDTHQTEETEMEAKVPQK